MFSCAPIKRHRFNSSTIFLLRKRGKAPPVKVRPRVLSAAYGEANRTAPKHASISAMMAVILMTRSSLMFPPCHGGGFAVACSVRPKPNDHTPAPPGA